VAGYATCDGGLVLDLSAMNAVEVDPERRTARAGGGATWADVDRATQAHGLATPGGVVSETGIAGLTLGGGLGWLRGAHGLSCDNLLSADVVTADGRRITASEDEHADLFWALRRGGGNFGVVTSFEYRLHEVGPEVFHCLAFHDGRGHGMRDALCFFRDYCETVPDQVAPIAICGVIPPGEKAFPEAIHGVPFALLAAMYAGPVAEGEPALKPLRTFAAPLVDFSGPMPYTEVQTVFDEDYPAHEMRYYWKSLNLPRLTDEVIDRIVAHAKQQPSPYSTTDLWHLGGAVQRVAEDDTAFSGRRAAYVFNPEANWVDPADDEANVRWARETLDAVSEFSDGRRYFNFPGFHEEGESIMKATFGPKYERLARIKAKYDPDNLFRMNQNVKPAG
jgi:FAD/FMN-containing dehydrogenase